MSVLTRTLDTTLKRNLKLSIGYYATSSSPQAQADEFRPLNLRSTRGQPQPLKKKPKKIDVLPPRSTQMPVDQDWGSVWPGPRTFHPATVPLPLYQGYVEKKGAPPNKYGNAELMKIPNFLHLTPPVIRRQCEALKKFCTPWPKALDSEEKYERHFPLEIISSSYCHSAPTIRNPLSRIVTLKVKLSALSLDEHARDKFLRLVGERYDEESDLITIVADRCPTRKQNYDYAMYLLTAVYHESKIVEPWEELKGEADMEYYDWSKSPSKQNVEKLFGKPSEEIAHVKEYEISTSALMNEGESEYTVTNYGRAVRQLLNLPLIPVE